MKLAWSKDSGRYIGRLPAGKPTALFIIERKAGGYALSGAFVPDGLDGKEYHRLEHAKDAAQRWLDGWVETFTQGWQASRPRIVCLCGSTRFSDAFQAANLSETLAGNIILTIGCDMKSDAALGLPQDTKAKLDELHLRKIDLADEVLILNVEGYIGESTRRELNYARERGKAVRFLEPFLPDKREPRQWTVTSPVPEGLLLKCEATGETALVLDATPEERRQPVPRAWVGDPERVKFYDDYLREKEGRN